MEVHQAKIVNEDVAMEDNTNPLANAVVEAEKAMEQNEEENNNNNNVEENENEDERIRQLDEAIKELERQIEEEENADEPVLTPEDVEMVDISSKEEKKPKKGKTSKYFGVSHIGKRWRAMFGGKYIGMADTEIEAAQMVNQYAIKNGAGPKNDVPKMKTSSQKVKKTISKATKVKKTKRVKKIVKRKK